MDSIIEVLMGIGGTIAAWFMSPEAGSFPLVQAAIAILLVVGSVGLLVFLGRRRF